MIRLLDYGTGTGLAAIELLKACKVRGLEERLERLEASSIEIHLADLPSSWFAQGHELLRDCAWTRFHSLRDADGRFRPLLEMTEGEQMDVIVSSMVFHLIPPRALPALAAELASACGLGGGCCGARRTWAPRAPRGFSSTIQPGASPALGLSCFTDDRADRVPVDLRSPDLQARNGLGPERIASRRAPAPRAGCCRRQTTLTPSPRPYAEHLAARRRPIPYEMLDQDFEDALLVPSNQDGAPLRGRGPGAARGDRPLAATRGDPARDGRADPPAPAAASTCNGPWGTTARLSGRPRCLRCPPGWRPRSRAGVAGSGALRRNCSPIA